MFLHTNGGCPLASDSANIKTLLIDGIVEKLPNRIKLIVNDTTSLSIKVIEEKWGRKFSLTLWKRTPEIWK